MAVNMLTSALASLSKLGPAAAGWVQSTSLKSKLLAAGGAVGLWQVSEGIDQIKDAVTESNKDAMLKENERRSQRSELQATKTADLIQDFASKDIDQAREKLQGKIDFVNFTNSFFGQTLMYIAMRMGFADFALSMQDRSAKLESEIVMDKTVLADKQKEYEEKLNGIGSINPASPLNLVSGSPSHASEDREQKGTGMGGYAAAGAGAVAGVVASKALSSTSSSTAGASSLGSKAMNLLRKIPGLNRILPVALVGAGVTMMATDDAHAGQPETTGYSNQPGVPSQSVSVSPEGISGTEIAAAGVSFAAKSTAEGVGSLAARFGLRAIPGIAAVVVAGDNLYDTAKYALRGEFAKAGTQVVAGFAETVAYIPGAITGATIGTALKEGIRRAFGEEIEHSMPVQLAQGVSEIVGSTTAPAANDKTFRLASGM